MPTMNNVKEAFEGESVAVRKYLAFAEIAQREGFIHAAKLFRALAESKTIHANIHLKQTGIVLSTEKNIQYAHNLEGSISEKRYQEMIDEAIKDGNKQAAQGFEYKKNIERGYAALCEKALNNEEFFEIITKNEILKKNSAEIKKQISIKKAENWSNDLATLFATENQYLKSKVNNCLSLEK